MPVDASKHPDYPASSSSATSEGPEGSRSESWPDPGRPGHGLTAMNRRFRSRIAREIRLV